MKVPIEWLNEFVVIDIETEELAKRLTMRGFEVEGVETVTPKFTGVIAATITKIEHHPNADNLSLCSVDTVSEDLTIVCGAPNVAIDRRVPLATVGASLDKDFVVGKRKVRGIESYGMLCSEKELGISDDHSGIFILPDHITPGTDLALNRLSYMIPSLILACLQSRRLPEHSWYRARSRKYRAAKGKIARF